MDEQRSDRAPHRYEDTEAPHNPPNSVLSRDARRATVRSYFVPIVALFVVIGAALVYWSNRANPSPAEVHERAEVGTVGSTQGGFDPRPPSDSTRAEIEFRAADLEPITRVGQLANVDARTMNGRRVSIAEAEVDSVSGNTVWVRDGDAKFAVLAPGGVGTLKAGTKISIAGHIQADDHGAVQIRADRVQSKS
jgi:hypothetical protein